MPDEVSVVALIVVHFLLFLPFFPANASYSETLRRALPDITKTLEPSHSENPRIKIRNSIVGFLAGNLSGLFCGFISSIFFRLIVLSCRIRNRFGAEIFSPIISSKKDLAFLEQTAGLADLELIGRGGSADVFLKTLPSSSPSGGSRMIAIKRIRNPGSEDEDNRWIRQIRSEVRTVGRIRHRNLLPLLAHVPRPDYDYLIYEYMPKGSLHDALLGEDLIWPDRMRIAKGIAAGLEHLHGSHRPRVVHRDLKPGNVLLDENLEARIADFGFAKEVPDESGSLAAAAVSSVAGTLGYIAPEYYRTMKYTVKCDVYSFGVIMAVIVTGRFPSDELFGETEEPSLMMWVRSRVREGREASCFDTRLIGSDEDEAQMKLVLRIACFCTADHPEDRPTSRELRLMLAQISPSNQCSSLKVQSIQCSSSKAQSDVCGLLISPLLL